MIHDDITASRHFRNKECNREVSFFVERDSKSGANLIIDSVTDQGEHEVKITHLSIEALEQLAVMFSAATNENYLEGKPYIETDENMVSPILTSLENKI